jgi:hypothetical protein
MQTSRHETSAAGFSFTGMSRKNQPRSVVGGTDQKTTSTGSATGLLMLWKVAIGGTLKSAQTVVCGLAGPAAARPQRHLLAEPRAIPGRFSGQG